MSNLITAQEFVDEYNYMVSSQVEEQDPETLLELKQMIQDMMEINTGMVVAFEFKDNKGRIKLL